MYAGIVMADVKGNKARLRTWRGIIISENISRSQSVSRE